MSEFTATVPPMECPEVLLPTPANLVNLFGNLITLAERAARSEIDELRDDAKKLKDIIQKLRETVLSPYDPKFKDLEIPEKEYEIMLNRLINEYQTYVLAKIAEIINEVLPSFKFTVKIMGVEVEAIKFATDRAYRSEILGQIDIDIMYDLLPPEYQSFKDKFDSADLRGKKINDFFEDKVKEFFLSPTVGILKALKDIGLSFAIPEDPSEIVKVAIQEIKDDTKKDLNEKIDDLKSIKVGPFSVEEILGGELKDNVEINEFTFDRLVSKLISFAKDYFSYLFKQVLNKLTEALEGLGLGKLIEFLTFTFCDFLTLLGFPKKIDLSEFGGIETVPNTNQPLENNEKLVEIVENLAADDPESEA